MKKIIIFGSSGYADRMFNELKKLNLQYVVDNDENKWGKTFQEFPIYSPEILKKENADEVIILVCSSFYRGIAKQLIQQMGFIENKHFMHVSDYLNNTGDFYKDTRTKVFLYGNCQTLVLKEYLNKSEQFNKNYVIYNKSYVFDFISNGVSDKLLSNTELFLYQKITPSFEGEQLSTDYLISRMSQNPQTICIPNAYFTGYYPQHNSKKSPYGRFSYGDNNIFRLITKDNARCSEKDINLLISKLSDLNYYSDDYLEQNIVKSLGELSRREDSLDIKISDYIRDNYKTRCLFYSVNHPSFWVIREMAIRLLRYLGIDSYDIEQLTIDHLNDTVVPIYPSVAYKLNLPFVSHNTKYPFHLSTEGVRFTFEEYMQEYILDFLKWGVSLERKQ